MIYFSFSVKNRRNLITSRLCFKSPNNSQNVVISALSMLFAKTTATDPAVAIISSPDWLLGIIHHGMSKKVSA